MDLNAAIGLVDPIYLLRGMSMLGEYWIDLCKPHDTNQDCVVDSMRLLVMLRH